MYKIFLTKKAEKELDKLASSDIKKVLEILPKLSSLHSSSLDIKKLVNVSQFYRLRIGKTRVIFEIEEKRKEIWIRKIGYRGGIYRF